MTRVQLRVNAPRWVWPLAFALLALYVAARMGAFALWSEVPTPAGAVRLPNTYATVDHPFHVVRADLLWRELSSGHVLRWIAQHQGGYPVEFYPLGEAWLEVVIRALSLGTLVAVNAHTLSVIALFLLPGVAFAALAREDAVSPAVALIALVLHVSFPGGWYDGGYTELVQWGLVTNVAAAVAAFLMLPALIRYVTMGDRRAAVVAALLAAMAVYCNPRSTLGLAALGAGVAIGAIARGQWTPPRSVVTRIALVAAIAVLLAAPELMALARFDRLYAFVHYSGYDDIGDYLATSVAAVGWPVLLLALAGVAVGLVSRARPATTATAISLLLYVLLTAADAFVPAVAGLAPQLEPTRLMPLQRLLTLYLASVAIWSGLRWLGARFTPRLGWAPAAVAIGGAAALLVIQTRPLPGPPPDPASPAIPPVGLYAIPMAAQPEQIDLEAAVRAAAAAAPPGTALLVLGSAMSWHQQLWAPLWMERPLFTDDWLWYWRPDHVGTLAYRFAAGNFYPDPENTLDPAYLAQQGIGAVVVTGRAREAAATSPLLRPLRQGVYDAYVVRDPVTTVTFDGRNADTTMLCNQRIEASAEDAATTMTARANWFPRWQAVVDRGAAAVTRRSDGYIDVVASDPVDHISIVYAVQPLDWVARILAAIGIAALVWLVVSPQSGRPAGSGWYAPHWPASGRSANRVERR